MLYSVGDLVLELRISRSWIYQMVKDGVFPPPKKIGRLSRWKSEDVERFLREVVV
ncbi:helix-turn-helix transcriptional regulator [Pseudomonas sp. 5C2]|uniref:helix-turn-helix transcriptional regulator n=1 Tax=Pseudomonas sp. 5C2 TaxID=3048588 RepID=UPI003A100900